MIIGMSGRMSSGKDSVGAEFVNRELGERYAFADSLKEMCIDAFGLDPKLTFGTQDDKLTLTKSRWDTISLPASKRIEYRDKAIDPEKEFLSIREILQIMGTDIMRSFDDNVWINLTFAKIEKYAVRPYSVITDVRFKNEAKAIEEAGGMVIRLRRNETQESAHPSELEMDSYPFKHIIDNRSMTMEEQFLKTLEIIDKK